MTSDKCFNPPGSRVQHVEAKKQLWRIMDMYTGKQYDFEFCKSQGQSHSIALIKRQKDCICSVWPTVQFL